MNNTQFFRVAFHRQMEAEAVISEQLCGLINESNPLQLCRYVGSPRLKCPAQSLCRPICGPLLRGYLRMRQHLLSWTVISWRPALAMWPATTHPANLQATSEPLIRAVAQPLAFLVRDPGS
jgi:hypothetical protein